MRKGISANIACSTASLKVLGRKCLVQSRAGGKHVKFALVRTPCQGRWPRRLTTFASVAYAHEAQEMSAGQGFLWAYSWITLPPSLDGTCFECATGAARDAKDFFPYVLTSAAAGKLACHVSGHSSLDMATLKVMS